MIGNIPDGWRVEKLGQCVDILDNQRIPLNSQDRENRIKNKEISVLYPYYGATQQTGYIDDYIFDEELVLLGEDGVMFYDKEKPKAYIINGKTWVNNHVHVLRAKSNITINKYLLNFLNTFHYKGYVSGATRLKLNQSRMAQIPIPIPPLPQQNKIVKVLDISSSLIEKQKELIKKYDLFLKSKFIEMFGDPIKNSMGWEVDYLDTYSNKITDGTHHSPLMSDNGYKYITAKHIKENYLSFNDKPTYVSQDEHKKIYSRCNPNKGDVLYIKDGATTGIACLNPYDEEFSLLSSVALIKPSDTLTSEYIVFYLNNKSIKENILLNMSGGAIKRLTIKKIKNIKIPLPPIKLQNKFTSIVEKIEIINKQENKKLEHLKTLHKSLMDKAFKGEII